MSKQASPFSSGGIEASLLRNASLSVYDFDDALFSDVAGWTRRLWSKRELWSRSVKTADVVIAGSDYLAAEASKLSGNVVMIPSCVEPNSYTQKSDYERSETPRAVWIGSPATERFLTMLTRPLVALHERFGLRVSVISAGASSLGALDPIIDRVQWSIEGFPEHLANADFGIMPLPDTPFTRGKCSYKLLQYAAAGLPLIGSPVGANERVLQTMGGLVATDLADWFDAVASILEMTSPQRAAMGAATHDAVTKHYSYSAWETTWKRALSLG